jgi:hypothetical protein
MQSKCRLDVQQYTLPPPPCWLHLTGQMGGGGLSDSTSKGDPERRHCPISNSAWSQSELSPVFFGIHNHFVVVHIPGFELSNRFSSLFCSDGSHRENFNKVKKLNHLRYGVIKERTQFPVMTTCRVTCRLKCFFSSCELKTFWKCRVVIVGRLLILSTIRNVLIIAKSRLSIKKLR